MNDSNWILASAFGAKLPWRSIDAEREGFNYTGSDTQEQIDKCLSCKRLACTNCLYERTSNRPRKMRILCGQINLLDYENNEIKEM